MLTEEISSQTLYSRYACVDDNRARNVYHWDQCTENRKDARWVISSPSVPPQERSTEEFLFCLLAPIRGLRSDLR